MCVRVCVCVCVCDGGEKLVSVGGKGEIRHRDCYTHSHSSAIPGSRLICL